MKNLLNFGVYDPLTLNMAHPVADRLETLGRAGPTTWKSRCLALSAMSVIAMATAPLSVAADEPQSTSRIEVMNNGEGYEIINKNGVVKAYRILSTGDREEVDVVTTDTGAYQLTYDDGRVIDVPNGRRVEKAFSGGAAQSEAFVRTEGEVSFEVENVQEALERLEGLEFSMDLRDVNMADLSGKKIVVVGTDGETASNVIALDDTVVTSQVEIFQSSDPLETARRDLARTKQHLERLAGDESVSFDIQNALRDIESARRSIEEAERRLAEETE